MDDTNALMNHPNVALILATGGNAMVRAAYSCGKPALGVGAGNVPAYIEKTAKLKRAVNDVTMSKSFDNGMVCASEQAVILDDRDLRRGDGRVPPSARLRRERGGEGEAREPHLRCRGQQRELRLAPSSTPTVVGQSPQWIAEKAGFTIPADATILMAEVPEVGPAEPLTREKLAPVLAVLRAQNTEHGIKLAEQMVEFDGLGHSGAIHSENLELVEEFGTRVKAIRIIWNSPSSQGGIGDIYNAFIPSLTLGCGSHGRNSVSNNVSAVNLVNIKRIGRRNNNLQWFKVPAKTYFEPNAIRYLADMPDVERVTIVTDATMTSSASSTRSSTCWRAAPRRSRCRSSTTSSPSRPSRRSTVGAEQMRDFGPTRSSRSAVARRWTPRRSCGCSTSTPRSCSPTCARSSSTSASAPSSSPALGELAKLVCIPTTSGTGAEVTPFAVITDDEDRRQVPARRLRADPDRRDRRPGR